MNRQRLFPARTICFVVWMAAFNVVYADEPFPAALTQFTPADGNPIFTGAGPGTWEVQLRERGWIDQTNGEYRLWYTGYDGSREGIKQLGLATSTDGLLWQRQGAIPVVSAPWTEDVCLHRDGNRWVMVAEGAGDQAHWATSADGVAWTEQGPLDIRLTTGEPIAAGPFGTPTLVRHAERWWLFYERSDTGVWLATSDDLKTWQHVQDEPVLVPGPDEFDHDLIALNQVFEYDGWFYAVFHGTKRSGDPAIPNQWATGLARSRNLLQWTKHTEPLRPIAENKSSGLILRDGNRFRLYTMHKEVHVHFGPAIPAAE